MKKLVLILVLLFSAAFASFFDSYYKIYSQDADILFMQAISALNAANGFEVYEIQSKNGYIVFSHNSKYYLLTLTKRYKNQTEIKIFPQNSNFSSSDNTSQLVFSLIDKKLSAKFEQVK